jgi:dimethylglycine dehydrogenase
MQYGPNESGNSGPQSLPTHARAVVIGGGVMGCSTLYHLARLGWRDIVLLERLQLTAGSTWHAAGMVPGFAESLIVSQVLKDSQETYLQMGRDAEHPVDVHRCGSIRISRSADEMLENRRFVGMARILGVEAEIIGPEEVRRLYPLLETDGIVGGLWLPNDVYTDPSQTTQAYARGARSAGAKIVQNAKVKSIERKLNGDWQITTSLGVIEAENVVNCGGAWAKEISALVGGTLPAVAIEHEYLVTEDIPVITGLSAELPMLWDMGVPLYTRADRNGLIVSCYEDHPLFFGVDGVPPEFGQQLLPPDLGRTENRLATIMKMIPALQSVGIRTVVNGPTPRSPDMMPLVGPAHGLRNFYVMCAVSGGFLFSSTARYLAEWMVHGRPSINLAPFDVRRFGDFADKHYATVRLIAGHAFEAPVYFPHSEHTGARPVWTSPLYSRLQLKGAVFGSIAGWERPNWFARDGAEAADHPTYGRANWFDPVGKEYNAVRAGVGVMDATSLGKLEISGPGAADYLNRRSANRLPQAGELRRSPLLTDTGFLIGLLLMARLGEERFYATTAPGCALRDGDSLRWGAPAGVRVDDITNRVGALRLAGPRARDALLASGIGAHAPILKGRSGFCEVRLRSIPVRIMRFSWGDIPLWELHTPMENLLALYETVYSAGSAFGIVDFGARAATAMRIEAGVPFWGVDIGAQLTPWQAGLEHFVRLEKGEFIGREAVRKSRSQSGPVLAGFEIAKGASEKVIEPWGDEPIMSGERCIGAVTSAFYGYGLGCPVGLALIERDGLALGGKVEIEILGERYPIRLQASDRPAAAMDYLSASTASANSPSVVK